MLQQPPLADHFPAHTPTMSAECEAVPPQPLATSSLPATSPMTNTTKPSEHHGTTGISYEGRVSVIPPMAGYEATMRAAMELDCAHPRDQQMAINTVRMHGDRHFAPVHVQQDFRRLYEEQARMHEANQMYTHCEEQRRQAYPQSQETCTPKEEPMITSLQQENDTSNMGIKEISSHFPQPQLCGENNHTADQPSKAGQSKEVSIKDEPQEMEEQQAGSGEHESDQAQHSESDTVLRFAHPDHHTEPTRSPIDKAGESPDLPTDSARTLSSEEQHESYRAYNSSYKRSESIERMSPYEESYQGNDDQIPSSMEPNGDDTTDSSMNPSEGDMDHLSRLQQAMELSGVMSVKEGDGSDQPQVFQCHICSYSGPSRFHFNAHLNTHYDHKCAKCEFTAHTELKLREHMQDEHGLGPDSTEDMEGIRVPRVNAQGKVKTFKCKQCDYVAITKGDFWEHARSHIKSEKLLTCPKCPFVTEYKHHLEYHLRNHFGSKPFKCNKCNYSCVNKSMLNSHMKSHSNIYQYRCADCTYATKYCHSLKLHLRKYGHNPAMVLNPDGTPNPIPIIDVYGTRRGPKLKKDEKGMPILPPHYQIQAELIKAQMQVSGNLSSAPSSPLDSPKTPQPRQPGPIPPSRTGPPHSPFPYPYPTMADNFQNSSPILSRALEKSPDDPPRTIEGREQLRELLLERERKVQKNSQSPKGVLKCSLCEFATDHREVFSQHMMIHATSEHREDVDDTPQSPQPIETSGSPEHQSISPACPPIFHHQPPPLTSSETGPLYSPLAAAHNLKEYLVRTMSPFIYQQMVSGQIHPAFGLQQHLQSFAHPAFQGPRLSQPEEDHRQASPQPSLHHTLSLSNDGVLDLSKEQTPLQQLGLMKEHTPPHQVRNTSKEPPPLQQRTESRASVSPNHSSPQSSSPPRSETSTPPSKNRRKGRAFKLERIALRLSESAEGESSGHDEDMRREEDDSQSKAPESRMPPLMPLMHADAPQEAQEAWRGAHQCQFCDMAFKDVVMYTMHMGYHGYRNPFTCNMCGHQATDKVAFFLHIARSSHS
ncbi:uncharacterized protein hb [Panulirus ornatus]|uniref:uncharacterized protein hb n=1 Tax=Panulirus ornatus TaxID=150431 RepID=UPI003A89AA16